MTFPVLTTSLDLLRNVAAGIRPDQLDNPTPCSDWTVAQLLLHAAGDQYAWASSVGSSPPPAYNPFAPAKRLDGSISELIDPAIQAATNVWSGIDSGAESVPTPLPPVPTMAPELAAGACALDAAIHSWDLAVATGAIGIAEVSGQCASATTSPATVSMSSADSTCLTRAASKPAKPDGGRSSVARPSSDVEAPAAHLGSLGLRCQPSNS
jgi:uncharacterized protein (TIGR03086 family)